MLVLIKLLNSQFMYILTDLSFHESKELLPIFVNRRFNFATSNTQICLSEFKRKDSLMTHLETHRADSRFVCGVKDCGSGFNQLIHLRKHISSTHHSKSLPSTRLLQFVKEIQ